MLRRSAVRGDGHRAGSGQVEGCPLMVGAACEA
ncbi:hypothetical protein ABH935_000232 [Catenulispora sp. GAS73]